MKFKADNQNKDLSLTRDPIIKTMLVFGEWINSYSSSIDKAEAVFIKKHTSTSEVLYKGKNITILNSYLFGTPEHLKEGDTIFINTKTL